jgi:SAM-dependent methyltransferase
VAADRHFEDPHLSDLYDRWSPAAGRGDFGFYLPLIMSARAVLDVGCGTGELLRLARQAGHRGRLCGLDPAAGMLAVARHRADIEWVQGEAASAAWDQEFDLAVMSGHAFQVLQRDDSVRAALAGIAAALVPGGRLAFETRHPAARAWAAWTPDRAVTVTGPCGAPVTMAHEVTQVRGELVSFTTTYTSPAWPAPRLSRSTLRFLSPAGVAAALAGAGLVIQEQYGDWDQSPLTTASPEIITIAGRPMESDDR